MSAVKSIFLTAIFGLIAALFANHVNNTCYSNNPEVISHCPFPWLSPYSTPPQNNSKKPVEEAPTSDVKSERTYHSDCSTFLDRKPERDLLQCLASGSENEVILYELRNRALIQKAQKKTECWAVRDQNKKFDPETTFKYLIFLNKDTAFAQKSFQGKRTVTIQTVLGIEPDVLRHPLVDGEFITDNFDRFEVNWSKVPLEAMNALLWARVTGHKLFPKNMDGAKALEISEKASLKEPADLGLKNILRDYKIALEDKEMPAILADVTKK